jgi:RNA recognition motif-containing protein
VRRAGGFSDINSLPAMARSALAKRMDRMKLYVGNLPYNISDDQLRDAFARFGTPDTATVIMDRSTGQSKGFGFVEFHDATIGKAALALDGTDFGGRSLKVNEARPRNNGGSGSYGGGRY